MQFLLLATILATGLSATASPSPRPKPGPVAVAIADPVAAPEDHPLYRLQPFAARSLQGTGRRLSRKHRHHGHHNSEQVLGTTTMTTYTTINGPVPTPDGSCTEDPDGTATLTEYTTITSGLDTATPTDSATTQPTPTDSDTSTPTDSSSSSDTDTPTSTSSSDGSSPTQDSRGGVIQAFSEQCGSPNATETPTQTSGPNGDESESRLLRESRTLLIWFLLSHSAFPSNPDWLNCGVDGSGWVPPPVTLDNLIYKDLATVLAAPGSVFAPCEPYLSMFQNMSSQTGVPTIFLASISLQESGCNPGATGGAGEIGMMQITSDKCPSDGSDCYDPMTNIQIGSQYFKTVLDSNNGNLAATMGEYNGWYYGLTTALANNYAICAQHNNLDYLQNVFNGYLQGVDPSSINMGIYHNTC